MEAPGGVEPPTNGLGNRCSIQLSYGANAILLHYATPFARESVVQHRNAVRPRIRNKDLRRFQCLAELLDDFYLLRGCANEFESV